MEVIIKSKNGLHARPASMIVDAASKYEGDVYLVKNEEKYSAKSIMGIMRMGLLEGDLVEIEAIGDGAEVIKTRLRDIIEGIED